MPTTTYGAVLRLPGVARLFVVSFIARIPAAMIGIVLTLHVVTGLGRGYAQAGVVVGAATVGMALGAPWRGRLVDRFGLRRAIAPSVVVESAVWFAAPHLSYEALIAAVFLGGLFLVPVFSVSRQSLSVLVPIQHQRPAFALDSVAVELTFMLSPVIGVLLATQATTSVALTVVGSLTVLAGLLLMWADPPTRSVATERVVEDTTLGRLLTPALLVVLLAGVAAAFVLVGTDVSLVAALNEAGRPQDVGWMIALWAGGSVIGGLIHGTARRSPSPLLLVAILALATLPAAVVHGQAWLAVAVVVAGVPCAPALSSINATLVRLVPEGRRGEVMGWSGTMATVGNALGAPLCGAVIDRSASGAGFLTAAVVGGGIAVAGLLVLRVGRGRASVVAPAVAPAVAFAVAELRPVEPPPLPRSVSADPHRHSVRRGMRVRAGHRRVRDTARAGSVRRPSR
ncbi:MFS transporter [Cellulomonas sp. URHE0023]|uniref:MFS transporter n=1 Tax=Cellulomonas sp. URHE0023 TaxID=1380354 RepID=UPI0009DFDD50|nr:MFS transporter [Cellulomonas sp. URHE0023]